MKRFLSISVVVILVASLLLYLRPVPKVEGVAVPPQSVAAGSVSVPWPGYGQSAYGGVDYGILATNGQQKSAPIASIAKVVTALAVLQKKPLAPGEHGPDITIGPADTELYNKYVALEGSVVPVNEGEVISEYQMLQAMLLPSGNNIADSLANWAFGSQAAYVSYANKMVSGWGLNQTTLADASGFSPKTVSSARNLVVIGQKALANPVLADIVSQQTAVIPVAGKVSNVNWLLGSYGVDGIKTGNTDQAGGCFLYSSTQKIGGQSIQIIGAIMGAPISTDPRQAINDSIPIIKSTPDNFHSVRIAKAGQAVGKYKAPWGATSNAVAKSDFSVVAWKADPPATVVKLNKLTAPAEQGQTAGQLVSQTGQKNQSVTIVLQQPIAGPSVFWRIFHL